LLAGGRQIVSATDTQLDAVRTAVEPAVHALGLDLYDIELVGGGNARTLRVTITGNEGVDLEAITAVTQAVSPIVDAADAVNGSYLLEVSSPGVERTLRRPEHYAGAIGEQVSVKFHTPDGPRRVHGALTTVDSEHVVVDEDGTQHTIPTRDITQARTVFEWGPQPRPGKGKSNNADAGRTRTRSKERQR
jgi:ribosome maturation factor RimP